MNESMGQIIKRLRKDRNFTQEELAEQLNISAQAVSKWENGTSMPDISQIVPLASVFEVSTDVLFGIHGISDEEAVNGILRDAEAVTNEPPNRESILCRYKLLREGLTRYPTNIRLLMNCLESGLTAAYPDNEFYDVENGTVIYKECVRMAALVISYAKNTADVMRAHMIMVLLHSAYGNEEEAKSHAEQFPCRCDLTVHEMYSYIAHHKKDYKAEREFCEWNFMYCFEAILDNIIQIGCFYELLGQHEEALQCFFTILKFIELIFADEEARPALHYRERGDVYALIAEVYLNSGRKDEALDFLEKMVKYDTEAAVFPLFRENMQLHTPLLKDIPTPDPYYPDYIDYKRRLRDKLNQKSFDKIRNDSRFQELLKSIK